MLCDWFEIIEIDKEMIIIALQNEQWQDLEDGLQMQCAAHEKLDYIITRNIKDFTNSEVTAMLPEDFLKMQEDEMK